MKRAWCPRCGWSGTEDDIVAIGLWPFEIRCCPACSCEKVQVEE